MSNNKSFTLIELLVVIAIIGVLSAIIITSMSGAVTRSKITRLQVFSDTIRAQLSDSLVSWWPFNEGTGTTVYDKWEGNNGTLHGDPTWKSGGDCVSGSCLSFDGDNDYVNCGSDSSLDITNAITVEGWVNFTSSGGNRTIYAKGNQAANNHYWLLRSGDSLIFELGNGTIRTRVSYTWTSNMGQWYHVIGTYNSSDEYFRLYIDGVEVENYHYTGFGTIGGTTYSAGIGSYRTGLYYFFDGLIDEVRIYNSAATISQIQSQYLAGLDKLLSNGAISKSEYNQRIKELSKEIVIE